MLRPLLPALLGLTALLTSACATGARATATAPAAVAGAAPAAARVYDTRAKRFIAFPAFARAVAQHDLVFFGEQHDDPGTHAAEHAVLAALGERRPHVVVTLEMFERDVQPLLDQYLAGTVSEAEFLKGSRPWDRYPTDYRPLVELARIRGWPVVAANVPRRLASAVGRRGLSVIDTLNATDRGYLAKAHTCPKDTYYEKFIETMKSTASGHGGTPDPTAMNAMFDRFYEAQCVKDEAMGEAVADAWTRAPKGTIVFHVDGAFHSDFGLGTVERARRRVPKAKSVVITAVPLASLDSAASAVTTHAAKADYLLFTLAPKK